MDVETLLRLAARAEAGGEGRLFDAEVFVAVSPSPFVLYPDCILAVLGGFRARVELDEVPKYSTSIDAQAELPGRIIHSMQVREKGTWRAATGFDDYVEAPTEPLARLAALLRALAHATPEVGT